MIYKKEYVQLASTLDQVISDGTLEGQLQSMLLDCHSRRLSPDTIFYYQRAVSRFIDYCHGLNVTMPGQVTTAHIRLYLVKLQEHNNSVSCAHHYRAVKRFCNFMVEDEVIDRNKNPISLVHCPKMEQKIVQPFSTGDLRDILICCDQKTFNGARDAAIVWIFLDTGVRLGEMARMRRRDVNVQQNTIKVMGKGARERVVRIGERAMRALLTYYRLRKDDNPALWVSSGGETLKHWGVVAVIRRLKERAAITDTRCSPHTFRHTFATTAFKNGAKDWQVQSLLGHSSQVMTQRYRRTVNSADALRDHETFSPADRLDL